MQRQERHEAAFSRTRPGSGRHDYHHLEPSTRVAKKKKKEAIDNHMIRTCAGEPIGFRVWLLAGRRPPLGGCDAGKSSHGKRKCLANGSARRDALPEIEVAQFQILCLYETQNSCYVKSPWQSVRVVKESDSKSDGFARTGSNPVVVAISFFFLPGATRSLHRLAREFGKLERHPSVV
jgi:hypothetical protein